MKCRLGPDRKVLAGPTQKGAAHGHYHNFQGFIPPRQRSGGKVGKEIGVRLHFREILLEASDKYNASEIRLIRAIQDAPSILERLPEGKKCSLRPRGPAEASRKITWCTMGFRTFFLQDIPHVLKACIVGDIEARCGRGEAGKASPPRKPGRSSCGMTQEAQMGSLPVWGRLLGCDPV